MEKQILKSVHFKQLKCLNDVTICFSDTLTAIMGVNGAGKTTVIHALACVYQPDDGGKGENHKFPEFFVPNTDSLWRGSELYVVNETEGKNGQRVVLPSRRYGKDFDRWSPRYENRPKRNVYYIGIDTCLPEIEKSTATSRIKYSSKKKTGRLADNIIRDSAYILNKPYQELLDNTYQNKHFSGVALSSGLKYSSLSMGTGEQRVLKILEKVRSAEAYSLILIDEIDLLLHISALDRLIEVLHDIAQSRHLQIVFTTHSVEMLKLSRYVRVQYIANVDPCDKTFVYEKIGGDLLYSLTGRTCRPIKIYVEDALAAAIVREVARKNGMTADVETVIYGSINNSFTLAASFVLCSGKPAHVLIVLDGDRYITRKEKESQIMKKLSGTEDTIGEKQEQALSMITQFHLPEGVPPEQHLHNLILKYEPATSELYKAANAIKAVNDSHQWLYRIHEQTGLSESEIVHEIFRVAASSYEMSEYIKDIEEWLLSTKEAMKP